MKYIKKACETVEAFQWTGDVEQLDDPEWIIEAIRDNIVWFGNDGKTDCCMFIETLEGVHRANPGDYIIRGIKGEIYPCKEDIFKATYEQITE